MIKEVANIYGEKIMVDTDYQKVTAYNNKEQWVEYNAKKADDSLKYPSYTDYREDGAVEDIETRICVFDSKLETIYASTVGYNANKNDPDKKIWNKFVDYVRRNESKFFDEFGDYRKDFLISEDEIREMVRIREGR